MFQLTLLSSRIKDKMRKSDSDTIIETEDFEAFENTFSLLIYPNDESKSYVGLYLKTRVKMMLK